MFVNFKSNFGLGEKKSGQRTRFVVVSDLETFFYLLVAGGQNRFKRSYEDIKYIFFHSLDPLAYTLGHNN